jgi:hypothetical protein
MWTSIGKKFSMFPLLFQITLKCIWKIGKIFNMKIEHTPRYRHANSETGAADQFRDVSSLSWSGRPVERIEFPSAKQLLAI